RAVAREHVQAHVFDAPLLAGLEVADDEGRARLLPPLALARPVRFAGLRRLRAARLRAVPLRPGAVPLLREPVGQPPARLLGQLEVPHVRDARDRAGAQVEDAQRIPRHVDRLRALLRLIERLLRGPQAEDDEAAVVAEHAALPPLDAERLCLAGER